jgi:orotidine-5'-phosphate decarboxylase
VSFYASFYEKLQAAWQRQGSMLCIGLDPQQANLPTELQTRTDGYFAFCKAIVDATHDTVCAYKPQAAHFAALGYEDQLAQVIAYIKTTYPHIPVILDAKRGDVGSTAIFYAMEAYERYDADAVTVSPYLGYESVAPYLQYADRGVVVLCRTSNAGSGWLQNYPPDDVPIYQRVAAEVAAWNDNQQCMLVTGATYPEELGKVREIVGDMPLLVPGVGAQGGNVAEVVRHGSDSNGFGLVMSSSRNIIFARQEGETAGRAHGNAAGVEDFAAAARKKAIELQAELSNKSG